MSAASGCVLVGYSAEGDVPGIADAQQRNISPKDAGSSLGDASAVKPTDGSVVKPADGGVTKPTDATVAKPSDASAAVPTDGGAQTDGAVVLLPKQIEGCGTAESCTPSCESGSCRVSCAGSDLCWTTCEEDTTCLIDCSNGGICDMNCDEGASCEVDCRGARDCDHLECDEGASCVLRCENNLLGCSLSCDGVAMTCPNNVHVCDAPCPAT